VVHSRDIEDCGGVPRRKFTLKPAKIPHLTMWQYWLGNTKPKKAYRLILNAFKKLLQNLKKKEFSTDWMPACLMPSDLHNPTMAKATGLIFSLLDVPSAQAVPFTIPLNMHTMHSSWTYHSPPLCPIHHEKCRFYGRHVMTSICYKNCQ